MLGLDSEPTIRHAILRRLDEERGVEVCEIRVAPHADETPSFLAVGVLARIDAALVTKSLFDLPLPYEHHQLVNEIDEICEQMKAARKARFGRGGLPLPGVEIQLAGNGRRGNWQRYG